MYLSVNGTTSITFFAFFDDFDKKLKSIALDSIDSEDVFDGHGMIHGRTVDLLWVDEFGPGTVEHLSKILSQLRQSDILCYFKLNLFLVLWA